MQFGESEQELGDVVVVVVGKELGDGVGNDVGDGVAQSPQVSGHFSAAPKKLQRSFLFF